ncbi:MAG: M28 family peptidase [Bacteroidales bacterium]|nr:M28 family peptidase [Bacteroidales bacterium]
MARRLTFVFLFFFLVLTGYTQELILIKYHTPGELNLITQCKGLVVHYQGPDFLVASHSDPVSFNYQVIDANPWINGTSYMMAWLPFKDKEQYVSNLQHSGTVLFADGEKAFIKYSQEESDDFYPGVHGGLVKICKDSRWIIHHERSPQYEIDTFPEIFTYINEVDTVSVDSTIQHLQDYGTRKCKTPQAVQAQNWLKDKYVALGFPVEIQPVTQPSGSSGNVIATQIGKVYPEEYVVLGAHYDSYTYYGNAPGADDNASGTAGVLEVARILSQYEFERTIIYCAFSAEEYGLFGSEEYAKRCEQQGMNILGYFNMDMISYQKPGTEIHSDLIAPNSAEVLVDFYTGVAPIYIPEFPIYHLTGLTGGDSDHTSFNEHGYMGIFPFEDEPDYSPYIHTSGDTIGPSVNCYALARKLIQSGLASVVSLARPYYDPSGVSENNVSTVEIKVLSGFPGTQLQISSTSHYPLQCQVINMSGKTVLSHSFEKQMRMDLTGFAQGLYVVSITGDGVMANKKVMVR